MAQTQSEANILAKLFGGSQSLNLAKYGGYDVPMLDSNNTVPATSSKLKGFLSGLGGFLGNTLDVAAPALAAAFPHGPLPQAINAANQAWNVRGYNKYLQRQQENVNAQAEQANTNNAGLYTDVTGLAIRNPKAGFDTGFAGTIVPAIRENNANPAIANWMETGEFTPEDYKADYGNLPELLFGRANDLNDRNNTFHQLRGFSAEPAFFGRNTEPNPLFSGKPLPMLEQTINPNDTEILQGNIQKEQSITPGQAGMFSAPNVEHLLTGRKNEYGLYNDMRSTDENIRSNKATEGETTRSHKANEGIDWYKAKTDRMYPPGRGGNSQNPYTIPNAQQNYLQGQVDSIDKELKSLGYMGNDGKISPPAEGSPSMDLFGRSFGGSSPDLSPKAQRARQLIAQREGLTGQITGGIPKMNNTLAAPFGGVTQAKQKLKASSDKVTGFKDWKRKKQLIKGLRENTTTNNSFISFTSSNSGS